VVVGPASGVERDSFGVLQPHWVDAPPRGDQALEVRIRHRHSGAAGRVQISPHGLVSVKLEAPARAVTPGQAAVFYEAARVVGGGWIV